VIFYPGAQKSSSARRLRLPPPFRKRWETWGLLKLPSVVIRTYTGLWFLWVQWYYLNIYTVHRYTYANNNIGRRYILLAWSAVFSIVFFRVKQWEIPTAICILYINQKFTSCK
jgi:hypothetical protein